MTKLAVMVVRDVRANTFGTPFFVPSIGVAERQFQDEINRAAEDNTMYKHPEDFELYHLGYFETDTAKFDITSEGQPLQVRDGRSMMKKPLQAVN